MRRGQSFADGCGIIWGGVIVASAILAVGISAVVPSLATVFLARPITILAIVLAIVVTAVMFRDRPDQAWADVLRDVPAALAIGALIARIGPWNDGSGSMAVPLTDSAQFVVTAGLLPVLHGPEAFLRFTALALILLRLRRTLSTPHSALTTPILTAVLQWIAASVILLVPTWLAFASSVFRGLALAHEGDALRILGLAHTSSYWSAFQADRFFAGIGRQIDIAVTLSSASIVFLIALTLGIVFARRFQPWSRPGVLVALARDLVTSRVFTTTVWVSAFVSGVFIAQARARVSWSGVDAVAGILALVLFLAVFAYWSFGRDQDTLMEDERERPHRPLPAGVLAVDDLADLHGVCGLVAIIAAALLGWPVLFVTLAVLAAGEMASSRGFGWMATRFGPAGVLALNAATFTILGGLIATRSAGIPVVLEDWALAWAIIAASGALIPSAGELLARFRTPPVAGPYAAYILCVLGAGVAALILGIWVSLAVFALLLLGVLFAVKPESRLAALRTILVCFGWFSLVAALV